MNPSDGEEVESAVIFDEWTRHHQNGRRSLTRAGELMSILLPDGVRVPNAVVCGSKGKGTAAAFASAALSASGATVGTVMSPGIISNADRVRLNGRVLDDVSYRRLLSEVHRAKQQLPEVIEGGYLSPTGLFTLGGAAALLAGGAGALVNECGMGGSSDEASLLAPDVLIFTPIFAEHLDVLGPTVEDVARDKLGLITSTTKSVVSAPQSGSVTNMLAGAADRHGVEVIWTDDPGQDWDERWDEFLPRGIGAANARAGILGARQIAKLQNWKWQAQTVAEVLSTIQYPGRSSMHELPGTGRVFVDSAINGEGLHSAICAAEEAFGAPIRRVLLSVPQTKDFESMKTALEAYGPELLFVSLATEHLDYGHLRKFERWELIEEDSIQSRIVDRTLVVGTVSFTSAVLRKLRVDVDRLFQAPSQRHDEAPRPH